MSGGIEAFNESCSVENNPNYQKAIKRIEIMKNKLYKEAQRRDEEEK